MQDHIYLDNNATTAVDQKVLEAMLEELTSSAKNPSSVHYAGRQAQKLLIEARSIISKFLKVTPSEIVFTSGGTESMNLLIRASLNELKKGHIISTDLEHSCVDRTLSHLESTGFDLTYLSSGKWGAPHPKQIESAIKNNTQLIVVSAVNSETGVKIDLKGVAAIAQNANIPLIVDGVALLGKESFEIPQGVTGMGFSAHKIHGPKGVGCAFVRKGFRWSPFLLGGHQERSIRGGTENLAGILGFARAISLLDTHLELFNSHLLYLRNQLESELKKEIPDLMINGEGPRVSNTSNICFPQADGEDLLIHLDMHGIAVSQGSACSSGALEPSRVLLNMGFSKNHAQSSLRFSLSRMNTSEEITKTVTCIAHYLKQTHSIRKK